MTLFNYVMSVKETPVTSAFKDANRVECALKIFVLIPAIARTFPYPPNITTFKIGISCLAYMQFGVTWELVKREIGVWLFAPPANLRLMGNSKCVNR